MESGDSGGESHDGGGNHAGGGPRQFSCEKCSATFNRKDSYKRHLNSPHDVIFKCNICKKDYKREFFYNEHMSKVHSVNFDEVPRKKQRLDLPSTSKQADYELKISVLENKLKELTKLIADVEKLKTKNVCAVENESEEEEKEKQRQRKDQQEIEEIMQILESEENEIQHVLCICGENVIETSITNHLQTVEHRQSFIKNNELENNVQISEVKYNGNVVRFKISENNQPDEMDVRAYVERQRENIRTLINFEMSHRNIAKIQLTVEMIYENSTKLKMDNENDSGTNKVAIIRHQIKLVVFTKGDNIDEFISTTIDKFEQKIHDFDGTGSGLVMTSVQEMQLSVLTYDPIKGGGNHIDLPDVIKLKKAVINPKNSEGDNLCFIYSVLAHFHEPLYHKEQINHYTPYLNTLKYQNLQFPLNVEGIRKFEKQNSFLSINVFELVETKRKVKIHVKSTEQEVNDYSVKIFYVTKQEKIDNHVNLLLLRDGEKSHYCLIKNLSALVGRQIAKDNRRKYICNSCFSLFKSEQTRREHISGGNCTKRKVIYPKIGENILKFEHHHRKMPSRFAIYCDFEAFVKSVEIPENASELKSFTAQVHTPCSYAYKIVYNETIANDEELNNIRIYRGENAGGKFIENLRKDVEYIWKSYKNKNNPIVITSQQKLEYFQSTNCYLCDYKFKDADKSGTMTKTSRVQDHDHITGKF